MAEALVLSFADHAELAREHAQNLAHGRAFVPGRTDLPLFSPCRLVLRHPSGATLELEAEVVNVLLQGVALQLKAPSDSVRALLDEFVTTGSQGDEDDWEDASTGELPIREVGEASDDGESAQAASEDEADLEDEADAREPKNLVKERQLRLRNLDPAERLKVARGPSMEDRIQLERIYGAQVWEPLLRNTKITVPEVARIAKKGTISRPIVDLIVENEGWIHQSIVRRALLSNPRLSPDNATKVLRTLSPRELKLVPKQTAYPALVRAAAQRLLKSG